MRDDTGAVGMTDAETASHLREYAKAARGVFSWPTDACGYDQHIRFVKWRNKRWNDKASPGMTFEQFVLDYADRLERGDLEAPGKGGE